MLPKGMPMSPSAALPAGKQGEPSAAALVVSVHIILAAKCILQYALSVVRNVRYRSSLERAGRYIVVSATTRLNWAVGDNLIALDSKGLEPNPAPEGSEVEEFSVS
jgi:hypothetical protein